MRLSSRLCVLLYILFVPTPQFLAAEEIKIASTGTGLSTLPLEIAVRKGFFRDEGFEVLTITMRINIAVICDGTVNVDVVFPSAGTLGRIIGTTDIVGEFENILDATDFFDYPDYSGVIVDYGPFGGKRYAAIPGVNFTEILPQLAQVNDKFTMISFEEGRDVMPQVVPHHVAAAEGDSRQLVERLRSLAQAALVAPINMPEGMSPRTKNSPSSQEST